MANCGGRKVETDGFGRGGCHVLPVGDNGVFVVRPCIMSVLLSLGGCDEEGEEQGESQLQQ